MSRNSPSGLRRRRGLALTLVTAALLGLGASVGCDEVLGITEFDPSPPDGAPDSTLPGDASTDSTLPADASTLDADGMVSDGAGDATVDGALADTEAPSDASDASDTGDAGDAGEPSAPDPVVSIAVGSTEACAVTASGALYCWGPGPVGDGTSLPRWRATQITSSSLPAGTFGACVGRSHACALGGSIGNPNSVPFCWGNNDYGQLATRSFADSGAPVLSPRASDIPPSPSSVHCGAFHTCVSNKDIGTQFYCSGSNSYGELGHAPGTQGDVPISGSIVSEANPNPTAVEGLFALGTPSPLALGNGFSCGVFSNQVSCWGNNASLQLNSLDAGPLSPSPVPSLTNISAIAAGTKHACALDDTDAGTVTCWGDNSSGQLGANGPVITADASAIGVSAAIATATHIAAGGNASCASAGAKTFCWGANEHGQLGHDPASDPSCPGNGGPCSADATKPVPISATALAMGPTATCAVKSDGTVWCWGSASLVGNGVAAPDASTIQFTPVQVQGLPPP